MASHVWKKVKTLNEPTWENSYQGSAEFVCVRCEANVSVTSNNQPFPEPNEYDLKWCSISHDCDTEIVKSVMAL
jgi:hypothetical protein